MVIKTWRVENFPSGDLARFLLKLDSTKTKKAKFVPNPAAGSEETD